MGRPSGVEGLSAEFVESILHGLAPSCPHPNLHVVIELERAFSRDSLTQAVAAAWERFPVLRCRLRPGWWRDRWVPWDGGPGDLVQTLRVEDLAAATRREASLAFEHLAAPCFRVVQLEHPGGCRLLIGAHHMVADGGGIKAAANVVAASLAGRQPEPPPSGERSLSVVARGLRLRDLPRLLIELLREGLQPLSMLRVRRLERGFGSGDGAAAPQWRTVALRGAAAERFVGRCRDAGATINDGLVAAVARLAAERGSRGPVAAAYTVDLRRYLPTPLSLVTNLHGVSLVVLGRSQVATPGAALHAVHRAIGAQKQRLPGLGYALLPGLCLSLLPHGVVRAVGVRALQALMSRLGRTLALTNIGALDQALAPLGERARDAWVLGPFIHGLQAPAVVATGFRGGLTLQVCCSGDVDGAALQEYADSLAVAVGAAPR